MVLRRKEKRAYVKLKNTRPLEYVASHKNHVVANSRLDIDACGYMCCLTGKRGGHDEEDKIEENKFRLTLTLNSMRSESSSVIFIRHHSMMMMMMMMI